MTKNYKTTKNEQNMKNLQKNFTTPEQSKRLLKMGVPEDSADCYFYDWAWIGGKYEGSAIQICSECGGYRRERIMNNPIYPCWSVGRMIEIYNMCANNMPGMQLDFGNDTESRTYIEMIVRSFELAADDGLFDFSKFEE